MTIGDGCCAVSIDSKRLTLPCGRHGARSPMMGMVYKGGNARFTPPRRLPFTITTSFDTVLLLSQDEISSLCQCLFHHKHARVRFACILSIEKPCASRPTYEPLLMPMTRSTWFWSAHLIIKHSGPVVKRPMLPVVPTQPCSTSSK